MDIEQPVSAIIRAGDVVSKGFKDEVEAYNKSLDNIIADLTSNSSAAAEEEELNEKFLSGWEDFANNPVTDYLKFAENVLKIPEAHQMVMKYAVLDQEARKILLLRPYQIHAIEAVRTASRQGRSGYIWHTTGSGKTMTSYKAARNLLIDIPSIEKTIFLIDRNRQCGRSDRQAEK